ncbi:S24 family peptidase [Marinobacter sp. JSM 1782161]|uniref:S24 family peptidase n=1 Tax=Marinobacter sp. JSM 1782161 TaxID=2685906 RepID=UPI0014039D5D|nr:helix-turn-helix transcriptional regulator [Marinobacter sp. JSM 1782161]
MDIHEIRRANLARLIDERFGGKQSGLADTIDRQRGYVSRLLKGSKNIGEGFARHIEKSVGIPRGSLDQERSLRFDNARVAESRPSYGAAELTKSGEDELEFFGRMDAWDSDTPLDEDEVELPLFREVELAAGAGQTQVIENHGAKLRFAKSTLARAGVLQENAACAFVRGNSMVPVMPDGTCIGVNTADTAVRDGEIYAIDHDGMLRVKFLHRRPGGGIKIVSQNAMEHPAEEYSADDVQDNNIRIIGRVFWWSVLR